MHACLCHSILPNLAVACERLQHHMTSGSSLWDPIDSGKSLAVSFTGKLDAFKVQQLTTRVLLQVVVRLPFCYDTLLLACVAAIA